MNTRRRGENKKCNHCGTIYYVSPSRVKSSRFCSKSCFDSAQSTLDVFETICKKCGAIFSAKTDHGKKREYCSRNCFDARADHKPKPREKKCETCGKIFFALRTSMTKEGLRKYCSNKCRHLGLRNGNERVCCHCGNTFHMSESKQKQRKLNGCCSPKCQYEFYVAEKHPMWQGGKHIDTTSNQIREYLPRDGFVGKYLAEHRRIAADIVGRFLDREEKILHINNDTFDNRPENLFICRGSSEMMRRINGSLPWPMESNLSAYV